VAKHYYYPGWWEGGPQLSLYVNQKAYDALPADYKAILASAASHAHVVMQSKYDAKNPAALKRLVAAGAKLHVFDKSILKAAHDAAMALYDDLSAKNPNWKKVYTTTPPSATSSTCGSASPKPASTTSCRPAAAVPPRPRTKKK
jgi:TRAP-type mannitol/chloroaromatic compound transport system substrate-binding protein